MISFAAPNRRHFPVLFISILWAICVVIAGCEKGDPLEEIRKQQDAGAYAATIEPLRDLLAERPGEAEIQFLYGRALNYSGQAGLADWSLRAAMADPEFFMEAGLQLAFSAASSGNYDIAIETTTRLLEVEPENVAALMLRSTAYSKSRQKEEEAFEDAERILELDPENLEILKTKANALLAANRMDEIGEFLDDIERRVGEGTMPPGVPAWHCATVATYAGLEEDVSIAENHWNQCLETYPTDSDVVLGGVDYFDFREMPDRSTEILRTAGQADPDSRQYRTMLAYRLVEMGHAEEAEALLLEATKTEDIRIGATAWHDLAGHYRSIANYGAAAEATGKALALLRQLGDLAPQPLFEYADALILAGEFSQAISVADTMTVSAHAELIRARAAQEQDQPQKALEHFAEAFRLWPDNPWGRYYAARAAEAIGDFRQAVDAYRYSVRLDASATDARAQLARMRLAEGHIKQALADLRMNEMRHPLDHESKILLLRLQARAGMMDPVNITLSQIREVDPEHLAEAVASATRGVQGRLGPEAAVEVLRNSSTEWTDPGNSELLRFLVIASHESDESEGIQLLNAAKQNVRDALDANPDDAALNEIQGLCLELGGAPASEVGPHYQRARQLDPQSALAFEGLGRVDRPRDPDRALTNFRRATELDSSNPSPGLEAASLLIQLGRSSEAEEQLEALMKRHPYDAGVAAKIVELHLARDLTNSRTFDLARRASRFGGGAEAFDMLSRVYALRDQPEESKRAAENAQAIRDREGG